MQVLYSPREFYDTLLSLARTAKKRVYVATLYLGSSHLEKELLESLTTCPEIHILLDGLRGSRGPSSSIEMVKTYCPNATVDAFVSPLYRGLFRALPSRANEIVGTQHMKIFVSDDTVLITGANLSDIYFTNRQDRYVVVKNEELANHLCEVIRHRGDMGEGMKSFGDIRVCTQKGFLGESDQISISLLNELVNEGNDTNLELTLSSPYLNISRDILDLLRQLKRVNIVTNSIETNAFFNSKGPSKYIPEAYAILQDDLRRSTSFSFYEYSRPGWSFHPKGLWVSRGQEVTDTVIGSSNFGCRSRYRDLEIQFRVQSKSDSVRTAFGRELEGIMQFSRRIDPIERPRRPLWLKFLTRGPLRTFL